MNSIAAKIEQLVSLRAQKSLIDKQVKELEKEFKNAGAGKFYSHAHDVLVTEVNSNPVNWKGLATDVGYSDYYLNKHTGERQTLRLTISAKKKEQV